MNTTAERRLIGPSLHFRSFSVLALITFFTGPMAAEPAPKLEAKAIAVRCEPIMFSNEARPIHAVGVLERRKQADLSFRVAGIVQSVKVRAGDLVAEHQLLAELRSDEIEAQLFQATTMFEKAQRDLQRTERLRERWVSTLEALQDARSARDAAEAGLRIAEFNRRLAVIVAPAAGRILQRLVEPDETVSSGRVVLTFGSDDEGWLLRAALAERDLARIKVGDRASVGAIEGHVSTIYGAADAATRMVEIEIMLTVAPPSARSGLIASATIVPHPVDSRPRVAASAVVEGNGLNATIYLVDADAHQAKRVAVEIEALWGDHVYLRTPLSGTAKVVVQGADFLRDGDVVTVLP